MRKILLLLFVLGCTCANALGDSTSPRSELSDLTRRSYRDRTAPSFLAATERGIQVCAQIFNEAGHSSLDFTSTSESNPYRGVEVQPIAGATDPLGKWITKWKSLLYDVSFVYVPEIMFLKITAAFFAKAGDHIGLPNDMILDPQEVSSSAVHETYHAYTYRLVLEGRDDLYAGSYFVNEGTYLSPANREFYFRNGSIDELGATALSVLLEAQSMQKSLSSLDYHEKRKRLNEIHHGISIVKALSSQLAEVIARLGPVDSATRETAPLRLGQRTQLVERVVYRISSYYRGTGPADRYGLQSRERDAEWSMYFVGEATQDKVLGRLARLKSAAKAIYDATVYAESFIQMGLEFPDLEGTNLPGLLDVAPRIFEVVESARDATYPIADFTSIP